jgi:alkanesulfonate monooxygenase SsuD/methylene tetrahydromethanopterin reductase-like flavin-dependent oxidoreductase (luciferase family)
VIGGPTHGKNPPNDQLHFGVVTGQHWLSWDDLQEQWQFAEETGLDSAWAFDHFMSLYNGDTGLCMDGWTLLGALALKTQRVQLGLLVTGMTHRHPSVLYKQAVTVDHISGGRLILGLGASWNQREHEAFGIEFPSPKVRVDRFAEAMEMLRLFETQDRASFQGEHFSLVDAPFEPKPVFGHMPVLIGSRGKRMMRIIARHADQWDGSGTPEQYREHSERLDQHCREIGRDPLEIRRVLGSGGDKFDSEDRFRKHVHDYHAVGVRSFLFDMPLGTPSPTLRNIAEKVMPELREELGGR